ncbi:amidase signature enzyme [Crepidotus variabilis]|uniref:Amidase signature enzyme n=1 Tax=Crepidotus variabilis TaxID=179855 RepID=A0A9P6JM16_9AGAR|nr:amidase signature enzyme [Crepidotus variabilis]
MKFPRRPASAEHNRKRPLNAKRQSGSVELFRNAMYGLLCAGLVGFLSFHYRRGTFCFKSCKTVLVSSLDLDSFDLSDASILELQNGLDKGLFSSADLVKVYFSRIEEINLKGPTLRAVLELNPQALSVASALDAERKMTGKRSMLHGIPILLKDNIRTNYWEGMNTTAGSYALLGSVVPRDAQVVKLLRDAGAIILGKTNLSEFAEFRAYNLPSGWSPIGGQCTNAFYEEASPSGSSSGSAVSMSIGLATVALGTETDTSITRPASHNNIVGIKPTLGLTSRSGVILTSEHEDSVGPMARTVSDAAIVLSVIAQVDPNDNYTFAQPNHIPNYLKALNIAALQDKRIGVPTLDIPNMFTDIGTPTIEAFENAIRVIENLGTTIVRGVKLPFLQETNIAQLFADQLVVLEVDFKIQMNKYLASLIDNPSGVQTLADLIQFNDRHPELEKPRGYEAQEVLINSEATTGRNSTYYKVLEHNIQAGSGKGIDAALSRYQLDALIAPAVGWLTLPAAVAGYPIITVPMGFYPESTIPQTTTTGLVWPAPGVPMGLSLSDQLGLNMT